MDCLLSTLILSVLRGDILCRDLCPHFTRLRILIFTHNRLQKDVDVGYVSIPLGGIKPGVRVEQWYPIKQLARTGGEDVPRRGSMRVGILVSVIIVKRLIVVMRELNSIFRSMSMSYRRWNTASSRM